MRKTTGMESRSRALNGKARGSKRRKATLAWRVLREVRLDSFRLCSSRRSDLFILHLKPSLRVNRSSVFLSLPPGYLSTCSLSHVFSPPTTPHAPSDPLQTLHYLLFPCSLLASSPEPLLVSPLLCLFVLSTTTLVPRAVEVLSIDPNRATRRGGGGRDTRARGEKKESNGFVDFRGGGFGLVECDRGDWLNKRKMRERGREEPGKTGDVRLRWKNAFGWFPFL